LFTRGNIFATSYFDRNDRHDSLDNHGILEKMMAEKWIQKAIKKSGALHRELGVPEGQKIPTKKLNAAAKKSGVEGKRARLAKTLKGF
jgi:hypothetical protein